MQPPGAEQQTSDTPQDEIPVHEEMLEEPLPSLEQQLVESQQQQQDYLDALRRAQADFINYKRRAVQERAEAGEVAQGELIQTLLPLLDDLGRALESAPAELAEQPWVQGIHLVSKRLLTTLQQLGVQPIGAPREPFDPQQHEAILTEPRDDLPEGTVVQVARPGYTLGARVLRPAQVVVAAAPEATAVAPSEG